MGQLTDLESGGIPYHKTASSNGFLTQNLRLPIFPTVLNLCSVFP